MKKNILHWVAAATLAFAALPTQIQAMPTCLSAGDPTNILGATVATFQSLGVDPASTCITNSLFTDPSGFALGNYIKGAEGKGGTPNPNTFNWNGATVDGTFAGNANSRDLFWVQDSGSRTTFGQGAFAGGSPSQGIIWDLGGQANQAVVFVQVDHGPLPSEVLENTAWLSNDPNAPDSGWTQALLDTVYLQGWSPDPVVADGFVPVYRLPGNQTFRYVSVSWEGPGSLGPTGSENEIDAVGGLTFQGGGLNEITSLAEPGSFGFLLLGMVLIGLLLPPSMGRQHIQV